MNLRKQLSFLGPAIRSVREAMLRKAVEIGDTWPAGKRVTDLRAQWTPGLSVIIPERGTPDLLTRGLIGLHAALAHIDEPKEVIVVVNGAPESDYTQLKSLFPEVVWWHSDRPLGFSGATARGLAMARYGAIYMHNSDMLVEADAIKKLMAWRAPNVFAIASQIFFDDPDKRREETGWSDIRRNKEGRLEPFERTPEENDPSVRSSLYASGGSSLYDAALLKRFHKLASGYSPFYWEDVDWGLTAWRHGLETLFHPQSIAWHRHRATVSRYYSEEEINRIVARNAALFEIRHELDPKPALERALEKPDWHTLKELGKTRTVTEVARARINRRRAPFPDMEPVGRTDSIHINPSPADGRPLVMVVTPYHILPPHHGGAWRTWRLCHAMRERWRFILVTDEGQVYDRNSWIAGGPFDSLYRLYRRPVGPPDRIGRVDTHSHAKLQEMVDEVAKIRRPDIIHFDQLELCGLKAPAGVPSVLTCHDVLITGQDAEADQFELDALSRFDAVIACSREDANLLLPALKADLVPNGAVFPEHIRPSAGRRDILFAGPFRYTPNLDGAKQYISTVFTKVRRTMPDARLVILGGDGARALAARDPVLQNPGVVVEDRVEDVNPWLDRCALTINPLRGIRGSSVKLMESLAAGRMCISTRDGARGFLDVDLPALVIANDIPDMLEPTVRLLRNEPERLAKETIDRDRLSAFSWEASAHKQEEVYARLLAHRADKP